MRGGRRSGALALLPLAIALLCSCHSAQRPLAPPPRTHVDYHAVADASLSHYQESMHTGVISPTDVPSNLAPVYPASLVAKRLPPVEIRALLIVGADGRVHEVRIVPMAEGQEHAAFVLAVVAATMSWRFEPLRITRWEDLPDGGMKRVADTPAPFSQTYLFRFEIKDGKPVVSTGAAR
jgi:hypothetical protein